MNPGSSIPGQHSPGDESNNPERERVVQTHINAARCRLRVSYRKRGDLRFLSHLDLVRTIERALRRSELPIAFSQGFNPRIRLSFPGALSTGVESEVEELDMYLTADVEPSCVAERLRGQLPIGIDILNVCPSPGGFEAAVLVRYEFRSGVGVPFSPVLWTALEKVIQGEMRGSMRLLQADSEHLLIAWRAYGGGIGPIKKLVADLEVVQPEAAPFVVLKLPSQPSDSQLEWPTDDTEQLRQFIDGGADTAPVEQPRPQQLQQSGQQQSDARRSAAKPPQLRTGGSERSA